MSDKRFFKVMAYAFVNTLLMSLFINATHFDCIMFFLVSTLVFDRLVTNDVIEKAKFYQKVLTDISNSPRVRGIGPIENSLNGVITKAEQAIKHFND